jgi:hypothetical protein
MNSDSGILPLALWRQAKSVVFTWRSPPAAAGTLRCAVLLRASPGYPSVDTRSAERNDASLKDTAEPRCLVKRLGHRGRAKRDGN